MTLLMTKPSTIIRFLVRRYINHKDGNEIRMKRARKNRKCSKLKNKTQHNQNKQRTKWHTKALVKVSNRMKTIGTIITKSSNVQIIKSTTTMIISKQLWWKYRTTSGTTKSGPRSTTRIRTAICSKVRLILWRGTRWSRRVTWAGTQPIIARWTVTT